MHPLLFGYEGAELSYRIATRYGDWSSVYWPGTAIRHDKPVRPGEILEKLRRHLGMYDYAARLHPGFVAYLVRMRSYSRREVPPPPAP